MKYVAAEKYGLDVYIDLAGCPQYFIRWKRTNCKVICII